MTHQRRAGLTLMELLIVLGILIALLAILLPGLFAVQARWMMRQADMQIKALRGQLEQYSIENKGYPTNEQGLYALAFIPDNVGVLPTTQPGMPGTTDPALGGMGGGSVAVGPEALTNPATSPMGMTPGAMPGATPGMTDPMAAAGGTMPSAVGTGMMPDPTGMGMGGVGASGMMTTAWTQPVHNPQIYLQQRRRSEATSYIPNLEGLIDPWGLPYRYDNSQQYNGLNQTGSSKPAIWSAGPDKQDGTDDDIRSWDPVAAGQAITLRQQQMQGGMGMGVGQTGTVDPMTGMPMQQNNMMQPGGMPPMTPPAGGMQPGSMPPMTPPAGGMQPGGMPPMTPPAGGMPQGGMPPMTPPAGGMPQGGMVPPAQPAVPMQ